jgi:hypothetical protein
MERRKFFTHTGIGILSVGAVTPLFAATLIDSSVKDGNNQLKRDEIQHMVIFNLNHEKGSPLAEKFLGDGQRILSLIPVVQNFQVFNQVSLKNDYDYGFSMVFANKQDYNTYSNHPDHSAFVENRWKKEVARFLEIDFSTH